MGPGQPVKKNEDAAAEILARARNASKKLGGTYRIATIYNLTP